MENYPQELAQDAVCQSHTDNMTGLWFLPVRPLRLNTNDWMKGQIIYEMTEKTLSTGKEITEECKQLGVTEEKL